MSLCALKLQLKLQMKLRAKLASPERNRERSCEEIEYEMLDTGVFDADRYFNALVDFLMAAAGLPVEHPWLMWRASNE